MAKSKKKSTGRTRANGSGTVWKDPKTGDLYGVITWKEIDHGKVKWPRRARKSISGTVGEANQHIKDLLEEREAELRMSADLGGGGGRLRTRKVHFRTITFGELAEFHKEDHLTPAEFDEVTGQKKSGLASWEDSQRTVDRLVDYWGAGKLVSSITLGQIRKFKEQRLREFAIARYKESGSDKWVTKILTDAKGKPRTITFATVHRELARLKRMLNFAVEEGWLPTGNPMRGAKDLIEGSKENKRISIASTEEEGALIDHCATHHRREHLAPYLITAFDHGCRSIELRRMLVSDIEFAENQFWVHSYKGKRRHDRKIKMTPRVRAALTECCIGKQPTDHVFTYGKDNKPLKYAPRRSFATLKKEAARWSNGAIDLTGFRGHDMRHTMITRAVAGGAPLDEVGKYAGHLQPSTTWRYLNPDDSSNQRITDIMARPHAAQVIPFKKRRKVA